MDYTGFDVVDFLSDDFFVSWVNNPTEESNAFWGKWLEQHPDKIETLERARALIAGYDLRQKTTELSDVEIAQIVRSVDSRIDEVPASVKSRAMVIGLRWLRAAAVLIAVSTFGLWILKRDKAPDEITVPPLQNTEIVYHNSGSESSLLRLGDGSLIILKPDATVKYPKMFSGKTREVSLEGEAFFEVHKNPDQPFLIHSGSMVTRVLGTSFTIRAFAHDKKYQVIVNTGKVLVYRQNLSGAGQVAAVTLVPHQQVITDSVQTKLTRDTVSSKLVLATDIASKEFTFNNTPVVTVIRKLETAYHVNIDYNEEELAGSTFTASLSTLPLDEKIMLICKAINASYDFSNGRIKITKPVNQ